MNVIAGILIGIVNESWLARIAVPFVWGFTWYFRVVFLSAIIMISISKTVRESD